MLKKLLCLISIFLLLFALPGCSDPIGITGSSDTGRITIQSASTGIADTNPEIEGDNSRKPLDTLTFYIAGEEKKGSKEVLDKVSKACGLNIGLEFKYIDVSHSNELYSRKIKTVFASNEAFDALYVGTPEGYDLTNGGYGFADMARDGVLMDITELLPQYAPDIFSQLDKKELEAAKIDGKVYAIPSLYSQALSITAEVDSDLMEKYGTGPIDTFEDYENYLHAIKENEPDIIPGDADILDEKMFMIPYGYVPLDEAVKLVIKWDDLKIIPWEQTEEFENVMSMLSEWQRKGYIASITGDPTEKKRASRLFLRAVSKEGPGRVEPSDEKTDRAYNFNEYLLYKGIKIPRISPIGNVYRSPAIALNAKSKNAEKTLTFLNWVQSRQENYDLLMYGIEGKHYTLDGEKLVIPQKDEADPSFYPYWPGGPFQNLNYNRVLSKNKNFAEDYRKDYKEFILHRTAYAPNAGFHPDYRQLGAEVRDRVYEYQRLITSSLIFENYDPGQMDSIIRRLKEAGTDKIVQEIQRQFDEWRGE